MPEDTLYPVYVLYGPDEFLRDEHRHRIVASLIGQADPQTCVSSFDPTADLSAVLDELRTLPFLADRRVVILREADAFISAHRAAMEKYLEAPAKTASLILMVLSWRKDTRMAKLVAKIGQAIACSAGEGMSIPDWLRQSASRRKKKIDAAAAALLVQWVGADLACLDSEIEKLSLYVGERATITPDDVSRLVMASPIAADFALTNAITAGHRAAALGALAAMLNRRGDEFKIAGMLQWHLRRAIQTARAVAGGTPLAQAMPRMPYEQQKAFGAYVTRRGLTGLQGDFRRLLAADLGMKSGLKAEAALQHLVICLAS
ncbi:MAG: DNA polymerase III subunit delta [Planctomycetota bacterium]|nr:DNA polymerase III subunit delta [Planctomycetota bacterium]